MMKLSKRLPRLYKKLDDLETLITQETAGTSSIGPEQRYVIERSIIQIQIEWEHFVRGIILDSCTGRFSNASGVVASLNYGALSSREAAAHYLVSLYPKRKQEPDWYLPKSAIDAALRLGISNHHTISAELGITPWPITELRHLRNFIAHKSKRSAETIRILGIASNSGNIDVIQIIQNYSIGGVMNYQFWINSIKGVARRITA